LVIFFNTFFFLDEKETKSQDQTIATRLSNFLTVFRLLPESPKIGSPPHGIPFGRAARCVKRRFCFIFEGNYIFKGVSANFKR
jgi:hypothetical protein